MLTIGTGWNHDSRHSYDSRPSLIFRQPCARRFGINHSFTVLNETMFNNKFTMHGEGSFYIYVVEYQIRIR